MSTYRGHHCRQEAEIFGSLDRTTETLTAKEESNRLFTIMFAEVSVVKITLQNTRNFAKSHSNATQTQCDSLFLLGLHVIY